MPSSHALGTAGLLLFTALQGNLAAACWVPREAPSTLGFSVSQPGDSVISGGFQHFDGRVCLDPSDPASGRIRLNVQTGSVDTGLPELDQALRGPVFFDTGQWPRATFASDAIRKLDGDNRYRVTGTFTLHGVSRQMDVPFTFSISPAGDAATLRGETVIKRLDYDIGQGQWADAQWADNEVRLKFSVSLARQETE